jgi:RES domain
MLDASDLLLLRDRFFRHATSPHGVGGYNVPVLQLNDTDAPDDEIDMLPATWSDWLKIKKAVGGRIFYNAPRLWRVGITDHYDQKATVATATLDRIVDQLSIKSIGSDHKIFRIRQNIPKNAINSPGQFDTPPVVNSVARKLWMFCARRKRQYGRFDDASMPIFYGSPSILVCLHECRVTLTDDIFVATLAPTRELRFINLAADYLQTPNTPFEDLTYFFNGLVFSSHTYDICRRVLKAINLKLRVDGVIYKSFFEPVHDGTALNYAIVGHPIADQRLRLISVNSVRLDQVKYDFCLGPALTSRTESFE